MARHRVYLDHGPDLQPGPLVVTGEEAQHAVRVKRVATGDSVVVLDGRGHIGQAVVQGADKADRGNWRLLLNVNDVSPAAAPSPRIEVFTAVPKGSRLSDLIDGLSQVGAASWAPLWTARGEVRPREGKMERLDRTTAEAAKQCGRAWRLEIGEGCTVAQAAAGPGQVVIADASGAPYQGTGAAAVRLLIGPEGGWTVDEMGAARAAGARVATFGPHVMRIETAAIVATAMILGAETGPKGA